MFWTRNVAQKASLVGYIYIEQKVVKYDIKAYLISLELDGLDCGYSVTSVYVYLHDKR